MQAKQKGFTLIELLVVIAITAIMAIIALPNMSDWIAARRVASNAEQIANLMRFARSEAVRLNLPVYVCPVQIKKDGKSDGKCDYQYRNSGLMAFADSDKDKAYTRGTDIHLRAIVLNGKNNERVDHFFATQSFTGSTSQDSTLYWTFLPDGNFVRWDKTSLSKKVFPTPSGYTKISLSDKQAQGKSKQLRANVLFVDGSGRVEICAKNDTRSLCTYSEK